MKDSEKIQSIIMALIRGKDSSGYFDELRWLFNEYETAVCCEKVVEAHD